MRTWYKPLLGNQLAVAIGVGGLAREIFAGRHTERALMQFYGPFTVGTRLSGRRIPMPRTVNSSMMGGLSEL